MSCESTSEHIAVQMVRLATTMMFECPQDIKDKAVLATEQIAYCFMRDGKVDKVKLSEIDANLTWLEDYDYSTLQKNDAEFFKSNTSANREAWKGF